jgi:iron uptake system EfeUOB component EfeO/EfeM
MARRVARSLLVLLALVSFVAACGGDDDDSTGGDAETTAAEDVKAPAAEVTTGLKKVTAYADEIVAKVKAGDSDGASASWDEMHEAWEAVEGTVKDNDEDGYLAIEDAMAALKTAAADTDADKAATGASDLKAAVDEYLKAYPG